MYAKTDAEVFHLILEMLLDIRQLLSQIQMLLSQIQMLTVERTSLDEHTQE